MNRTNGMFHILIDHHGISRSTSRCAPNQQPVGQGTNRLFWDKCGCHRIPTAMKERKSRYPDEAYLMLYKNWHRNKCLRSSQTSIPSNRKTALKLENASFKDFHSHVTSLENGSRQLPCRWKNHMNKRKKATMECNHEYTPGIAILKWLRL